MNLPNWITVARICLVPVFLLLAYGDSEGTAIASFVVFLTASVSDVLDGYLARRHGTVSRAGKFLDPLADKLLVGAALVVLVDARSFPLWAAIAIALREVAIQWLRVRVVRGGDDLPASAAAKVKTVSQLSMISWWLLPWAERNTGHWVLLGLALTATLWSGFEYFFRAWRDRSRKGEVHLSEARIDER